MTDTMEVSTRMEPVPGRALAGKIATDELAAELLARADAQGVSLVGPGGLLAGLTKTVLEAALDGDDPSTWATSPTTPPGTTRATAATGPGPKRRSPRWARSRSTLPRTATGPSSP